MELQWSRSGTVSLCLLFFSPIPYDTKQHYVFLTCDMQRMDMHCTRDIKKLWCVLLSKLTVSCTTMYQCRWDHELHSDWVKIHMIEFHTNYIGNIELWIWYSLEQYKSCLVLEGLMRRWDKPWIHASQVGKFCYFSYFPCLHWTYHYPLFQLVITLLERVEFQKFLCRI